MSSFRKKGLNILFWSVISAAFIGPGTVTTALSAGARFNYQILWTLVFATLSCAVLQEAAARISISTGKSLGEIIAEQTNKKTGAFLAISVIFGCTAYQAGNMLGAVSGIELIWPDGRLFLTIALFVTAFMILWSGGGKKLMQFLGLIVALMGIAFIIIVLGLDLDITLLIKGAFIPSIPSGSAVLTIGLIGTTIVPYNLFLGSGISKGQSIKEMREGLIPAVIVGGIFSIFILLAGTILNGEFSFSMMYQTLNESYGTTLGFLFALGLFSAGFTSSLTSPIAASYTANSIFSQNKSQAPVKNKAFRITWILVLSIGFLVGILNLKAIPVIIAAQAINGLLLPFLVISITLIINNQGVMQSQHLNSWKNNALLIFTLFVTSFLGVYNILRATLRMLNSSETVEAFLLPVGIISLLIVLAVLWKINSRLKTKQE